MSDREAKERRRYVASMNRSLTELERMVKGHEEALRKVLHANTPSSGVPSPVESLEILTAAYQDAAGSAPALPSRDSLLPALLAKDRARNTVMESGISLEEQISALEEARQRLEAEQSSLEDQRVLRGCLEERIQELRQGLDSASEPTAAEATRARIQELRLEKRTYDEETTGLLKTFNRFVEEQLAPLLAAEDLGGPVVGDLMDVDSAGLVAGFSSRGKPRKSSTAGDADRRQQRIDEIWGSPSARPGAKTRDDWDEAVAAASDMRELTEQLLQGLVESEGDHWAAYVKVARESAAARFLVRSRVAQFHPKDATRLRLVDFGKDLDD